MRVLIIKTSSMGDIIHTFPALTDAGHFFPQIEFDWLVEENFKAIPGWHPLVKNTIPVALRRWRKQLFAKTTWQEFFALLKLLRARQYDYVIDAQSLIKSAFFTFLANGKRTGLDWSSARESLASLVYHKKCKVNFYQQAIVRMRQLFSLSLDYPLPATLPEAGLLRDPFLSAVSEKQQDIVFLPGTTWTSKMWPETYWIRLAKQLAAKGFSIKMSGGNDAELAQAQRIAAACPAVCALPRLSIPDMAVLLANAKGVVAVDTGFAHLATTLNVPTVVIYGATNPAFTGAIGKRAIQLRADFPCSPCLNRVCHYQNASPVTPACYGSLSPETVGRELQAVMALPA